jgi:hypothetical protein
MHSAAPRAIRRHWNWGGTAFGIKREKKAYVLIANVLAACVLLIRLACFLVRLMRDKKSQRFVDVLTPAVLRNSTAISSEPPPDKPV